MSAIDGPGPLQPPAARLHALFAGAERSHGTFGETYGNGVKREIRDTAQTIKTGATVDHWVAHVAGTRRLGIVPIREDATCLWAAIDVDDYTADPGAFADQLMKLEVPALVCRTKSGGSHIFVFFTEPIPAADVIPRMRELAVLLGRGSAEIFPKQERVDLDRGDFGSWLNMPYFNGDGGDQFCVRPDGRGYTLAQFLTLGEKFRQTRQQLLALPLRREAQGFASGPPCLEHLAVAGLPEGTRNKGLYNYAILAKKMQPDGWEPLLHKWNAEILQPPLTNSEVQDIVKRLSRKDYHYSCKDEPIRSVCNSAMCRTRPHGVGDGAVAEIADLISMRIVSSDPAYYYVTIEGGKEVECTIEQVIDVHHFQLCAARQHRRILPDYPRASWRKTLQRLMDEARIEVVSVDSGIEGKFNETLENFIVDKFQGASKDDVLEDKPWHDEVDGHVWFLLLSFEKHLDKVKFVTGKPAAELRAWVTRRLRALGGVNKQLRLKGVNRHVWKLPDKHFSWGREASDLPAHEDSPL